VGATASWTAYMEAVRGAASSPAVARLLGVELRNGIGRCPFHEDGNPSFQVHEGGGWKCYTGCGAGSDGMSLWFHHRGSQRREDIEALGLALGCGVAPSNGNNGKARGAGGPALGCERGTPRRPSPPPWRAVSFLENPGRGRATLRRSLSI